MVGLGVELATVLYVICRAESFILEVIEKLNSHLITALTMANCVGHPMSAEGSRLYPTDESV
jgi:hypothetical protein